MPNTLHRHTGSDSKKVSYKDLDYKPYIVARTSISADLSGDAITLVCLHIEAESAQIIDAYLLYTEASSADDGVDIEIGKESDRDYYYTGTSEISKDQWYTNKVTLLKKDISKGDTVTLYSAGAKDGTGEVMLIIEYLTYK